MVIYTTKLLTCWNLIINTSPAEDYLSLQLVKVLQTVRQVSCTLVFQWSWDQQVFPSFVSLTLERQARPAPTVVFQDFFLWTCLHQLNLNSASHKGVPTKDYFYKLSHTHSPHQYECSLSVTQHIKMQYKSKGEELMTRRRKKQVSDVTTTAEPAGRELLLRWWWVFKIFEDVVFGEVTTASLTH